MRNSDFCTSQGEAIERIIDSRAPKPLKFRLIGRENEIRKLKGLLLSRKKYLISILGVGGVGKTTLARYIASEVHDRFDKVNFIELEKLAQNTTRDQLLKEIANGLGITEAGQHPLNAIVWQIANKKELLILDNFEQLQRHAESLAQILERTENLIILVTSRKELELAGEQKIRIQGLTIAADLSFEEYLAKPHRASALQLLEVFMQEHEFELNQDNFEDAKGIVKLTGGLPLGLKLVSAWFSSKSLKTLIRLIQGGTALENSELVDISERHRSITRIFELSKNLLASTEQQAFANLSIFETAFSPEAAKQVCGLIDSELDRIVSSSLLEYSRATDRFYFHPLIRQYATTLEKTDELDIKHAEYFLDRLELMSPKSKSYNKAVKTLTPEILDITKTWKTAIKFFDENYWLSKVRYLRQLLDQSNNHSLGIELLELSCTKIETATQLGNLAWLQMRVGSSESEINAQTVLKMQADKMNKSTAFIILGAREGEKREFCNALKYFSSGYELHEPKSKQAAIAMVNMALMKIHLGEFEESEMYLLQAEVSFQHLQHIDQIVWTNYIRTQLYEESGEPQKVIELALKALKLSIDFSFRHLEMSLYRILAQAYINLHDPASAKIYIKKLNMVQNPWLRASYMFLQARLHSLTANQQLTKLFLKKGLEINCQLENKSASIQQLIDYIDILPSTDTTQEVYNYLKYKPIFTYLAISQRHKLESMKIKYNVKNNKGVRLYSLTPDKVVCWLLNY